MWYSVAKMDIKLVILTNLIALEILKNYFKLDDAGSFTRVNFRFCDPSEIGFCEIKVSCGVIIPEELPSLLSVAYSNIPPIKKGTDSRVGFGFAFGNHADFQVMFELGPQTETEKLSGGSFQSSNKRQTPASTPPKINKNREKFLQSEAGKYLSQWATKMRNPKPTSRPIGELPNLEDSVVELVRNDKGEYEIHQPKPGHMPQRVLDELHRLYGEKKEEAKKLMPKKKEGTKQRTEEEVKKITEDLSNVDLD